MTAKASPNLFGDAPLSTEQILGQVHDRLKQSEAEKQQDIFSSQGNDDTGNGKPSETGQGPASSQSNAATPKSDTAVTRPTVERPKNPATGNIQDFGEKLDGAKKHLAAIGITDDVTEQDIAKQPLSKIWDKDAYKKDENKVRAALNYVMRSELPTKPRVSYRLNAWVNKVIAAKDAVNELGQLDANGLAKHAKDNPSGMLSNLINKALLLQDVPVEQWGRVGEVRQYPNAYGYDENGIKINSPQSSIEIDGKTVKFSTGSILDAATKVEILEKLGQQQEKPNLRHSSVSMILVFIDVIRIIRYSLFVRQIKRSVHLKSLKLVHHQGMCSSGLEIILIYYRRRGSPLRAE